MGLTPVFAGCGSCSVYVWGAAKPSTDAAHGPKMAHRTAYFNNEIFCLIFWDYGNQLGLTSAGTAPIAWNARVIILILMN